jgi:hypothetical protein
MWTGHVAQMGEVSNAHKILVANLEGMRTFGRRRPKWKGKSECNLGNYSWKLCIGYI